MTPLTKVRLRSFKELWSLSELILHGFRFSFCGVTEGLQSNMGDKTEVFFIPLYIFDL